MGVRATTVEQATQALEAGAGPVEVSQALARQIAKARPEFFDGWPRAQRLAAFGQAPYSSVQYEAFVIRVMPDADIPRHGEVKARKLFDGPLASAREHEEVAAAAYEVAEKSFLNAAGRLIALEAGGPLIVTTDGQPFRPSPATVAEVTAARAAEAEAREAWKEAGDVLHRARVKLNAIEHRIDAAARRVRLEG